MRPSQAEKVFRRILEKAIKSARKRKRKCLFPECCETAIASHSQQRERELRAIEEGGHVYATSRNLLAALGVEDARLLSLQGIAKATTFSAFCAPHDRDLFRVIDSGPLLPSAIRAGALALRAVAHEWRRKETMVEVLWTVLHQTEGVLGDGAIQAYVEHARGMELALRNEIPRYLRQFGIAAAGSADHLCCRWLTVNKTLGLSCTTVMSLLFKQYELRMLSGKTSDEQPVVALSIVPDAEQTHVVVTWCNQDDRHSSYIRGELESIGDLSRLSRFLNRLAFAESEDTTLRPSLWDALPSEQKQCALRCLKEVAYRSHVQDDELPQVVELIDESVVLHAFP